MADDDTSLLPAGMRNNNPLNIKYTSNGAFDGVVGPSQNLDEGDPQAVFQTPQHGMNAAASLLLRKYNSGMTSANSIIAGNMGWTPGNRSAAANVAKTFGADPNEDLNLRDPQRMASFMRALATQEQGGASRAYGPDVYATAASHALGGTGQPMAQPIPGDTGGLLPSGPTSAFATMPFLSQSLAAQPTIPPPAAGIQQAAPQAARPGFFGSLQNSFNDPNTQYWLSILGQGLSGKDIGTAQATAAQAQTALTKNQIELQRIRQWAQLYGQGQGQGFGGASPAGMGAIQPPQASPTSSAPSESSASSAPSPGPAAGAPAQGFNAPNSAGYIPPDLMRMAGVLGPDEGPKLLAGYLAKPRYTSTPIGLFDEGRQQYAHLYPNDEANVVLPPGVSRKQGEEATGVMDQTDRVLANTRLLRHALGDNEDGTITPSPGVQHAIGPQPDIEMWQQLKASARGAVGLGTPSQDARNQIQQYASQVQNYLSKLEGVGGTATDAKLKSLGEQVNTLTKSSDVPHAIQLVRNIENELMTLRQNYQPRLPYGTPRSRPISGGMEQQPPQAPPAGMPPQMPQGASPWPAPGQPQPAQPAPAPVQQPQTIPNPQTPQVNLRGQRMPNADLPLANMKHVASDADYAAIARGEHYVAPDGSVKVKQ